MSLKDILVHLPSPDAAPSIMNAAISLARRHGAHLTAEHVYSLEWPMMAAVDGYVGPATWRLIIDEAEQTAKEKAAKIQARFEEAIHRENIPAEWRLSEGLVGSVLAQHARYADVTILSRSGQHGIDTDLIEEVLFDAGRPVLLLPPDPPNNFAANRVLVGWNGRREAARAVGDALPLIHNAEAVQILSVFSNVAEREACQKQAEDIAHHLARHGAKVSTATTMTAADLQVEDVLLNTAADFGADLLVVGGYGHGRMREMVLGGVTRSLLQGATVPVLLSH